MKKGVLIKSLQQENWITRKKKGNKTGGNAKAGQRDNNEESNEDHDMT